MSYFKGSLKLKITVFLIITALIFWLIPSNLIFAEEGQTNEEETVTEETSGSSEESIEEEVAGEEVTEEETEEEVTEEETSEEETAEGEVTEEEVTEEETSEETENEEPIEIENSGGSTEGEITDEEATEEELTDEEVLPEEELLEGEEAVTEIVEVEEALVSTPTLSTDKPDYMPEDTVLVSGSGYEAGETLLIRIVKPNGSVEEDFLVVNSDGSISYSYNLVNGEMATYLVHIIEPEKNEALSSCSFTDVGGVLNVGTGFSYTTIQEAVDAALENANIVVSIGTYNENVTINKALSIFGPNKDINPNTDTRVEEAVVDGGLTGNVFNVNADGVTINGFTIRNGYNGIIGETSFSNFINNIIYGNLNSGGSNGIGILLWGNNDNNKISENEIYNNDRQGVFIGYDDFDDNPNTTPKISSGNIVSDNVIHDNGLYTNPNGPDASAYGVQLWNADNNLIVNNEIYNHDNWFRYPITDPTYDYAQGIYLCASNNNIVQGNYLHNNNYGVGLYSAGRTLSGSNQITSNNISNNTGYGIMNRDSAVVNATSNWWGSATGPNNATTNPSGTGNAVSGNVDYSPWWGDYYVGVAFPWTWYLNTSNGSTIQEGINAASAGDTINVAAGTYNENIIINKTLSILGNNSAILDGSGIAKNGFLINAANVVINGFDIKNFDIGIRTYGGPSNFSNLDILNTNIHNNIQNGILIVYDKFDTITIGNCDINNNSENGIGIADGASITNLNINDTDISGNAHSGLYIASAGTSINGLDFNDMIIKNNKWSGIHVTNGSSLANATLSDCIITGNDVNFSITSGANVVDLIIKNSELSNSPTNHGFWLRGATIDGLTFEGTEFNNNKYQGFYVSENATLTDATISGGSIQGNAWGLLTRASNVNNLTILGVIISNNLSGCGASIASGTVNGFTVENCIFEKNAWEHLDIGVGWIGLLNVSNVNIKENTFYGGPWACIYVDKASDFKTDDITIVSNNFLSNALGIYNGKDVSVNAVGNWWGDPSGPSGVGFGTGDAVSSLVNYDKWLNASYPGGSPINFVDVQSFKGNTFEDKEIGVGVNVDGGAPTVTVGKYSTNPGSGFANNLGLYVDLHIDTDKDVKTIVFRMYYTDADLATAGLVETSLKARFWDGSKWEPCSDQYVDTDNNCIVVTITLTTTPSISDLVGTAFAASGNPSVTPVTPVTPSTPVSAPVKATGGTTSTSTGIEVLGIQELPFTGVNPLIPISGISTIFAGGLMVVLSTIRKRFGKK